MSRQIKLLIALIITATVAAYVIFVTIPTRLAKRSYEGARAMGKDIREALRFTPEVKVNNTIVVHQQTSAFELSVLRQKFEHRYVWEHAWLGSTKKIFITGTFDASIGFDLHRKFTIEVNDRTAYVKLTEPRVLAVESMGDMTYRDEQGIWNWVSVNDRTRATNAFVRDARRHAGRAAFLHDAKDEMEDRLRTLLSPYVDNVIVTFETPGREPL